MKIEFIEDKKNPLLNRREVRFRLTYTGATPTMRDIRGEVISNLKSDERLTIMEGLKPEYGSKSVIGYVKVYDDGASMNLEPKYRIEKNLEGKKKKAKKVEETPKPAEGKKPEGKKEPETETKGKKPEGKPESEKEPRAEAKEEKPESEEKEPKAETKKEAPEEDAQGEEG